MSGWLPAGTAWNYWQQGYDPIASGRSAIVQACISAYAQTIAMCQGAHWRATADGGREKVTNSALSRILRSPNAYQSSSDFLLNLVSFLYDDGNAYALALRNDRNEIAELHLMRSRMCGYRLAPTGDVFYGLGGNEIIDRQFAAIGEPSALHAVPARDVLHVRLETPRHPLKGETPLCAAMLDLAASNAMARQAIAFYDNQSRPSGTLSTDLNLSKEQVDQLRARWNEQSRGLNSGGTPILTNGLKWSPMTTTARDSQFADIMKMTDQNVALAFRVPLQILGMGGTPFASTELLMQSWIAMGLGFALNHVEQAFDRLFGLYGGNDEYTEFDTSVLLRSAFKDRIDGYTAGVHGGIFAPNEARREFELPAVKFGDEPRVQQQDVPLSYGMQLQPNPAPAAPKPSEPADQAAKAADVAQFTRTIDEAIGRHGRSIH
jgi:HK97 family phage portal protein